MGYFSLIKIRYKPMKKLLAISLFLLGSLVAYSQITMVINFKFINIEEGYDHQCKTLVLIDGETVGESKVTPQSKGATFTVKVPKGNHELSVVNWALYEGNWEEHTIANNYSIDATYSASRKFKKPEKLYLLFDLDEGTRSSWNKPVK